VPFVHQSSLSGLADIKHYRQVWYHRTFDVPANFTKERIRLNVGAVDFEATVWVNSKLAGIYEGGYTPFSFDITDLLNPAGQPNHLTIRVYDNELDPDQPRGKQHPTGETNLWHYTHLTGIWQTVWLEAVGTHTIENFKAVTTIDPPTAKITVQTSDAPPKSNLEILLIEPETGKILASARQPVKANKTTVIIKYPDAKLWSHIDPALYDLKLQFYVDGKCADSIKSYIGFREVSVKDGMFCLNGKPVWLNGVMDQGYYPDGLYTARTDEEILEDVKWVKRLGLNHIRKSQIVADPRYLYHCDRLGVLVWGEMANAGEKHFSPRATEIALREWKRTIDRDFNHPSIVTWVYSNENWMHAGELQDRIDHYRRAYQLMKEWDPTRPVIDTSGYYHVESDIMDTHNYPKQKRLSALYLWAQGKLEKPSENIVFLTDIPYKQQPIVVSEWVNSELAIFNSDQVAQWLGGYIRQLAQFASHPLCAGQCYVQLYDIETECNGYLYYDRRNKFTPKQEAVLLKAHLQAEKRDLNFDWEKFIKDNCPETPAKEPTLDTKTE